MPRTHFRLFKSRLRHQYLLVSQVMTLSSQTTELLSLDFHCSWFCTSPLAVMNCLQLLLPPSVLFVILPTIPPSSLAYSYMGIQ